MFIPKGWPRWDRTIDALIKSQKFELRASEIRQRLNEISGLEGEGLTDEIRAESDRLVGEFRDVETRRRASVVSESDESAAETTVAPVDGEARERRALMGRALVGRFTAAALVGRSVDGVEAEIAAACGCPGRVPLEMLTADRGGVEHRAITAAPDTGTAVTAAAIMPAVFDQSAAAFLGVEMPVVPAGTAAFPVLTQSVTAGARAKGAAAPETAGTISPYTVTPRRITGAFRIAREDEAMLPDLESALRDNLGSVLSDTVDGQVVGGCGVAPNLNGISTQLTAATAPAAGVETFDRFIAAAASHVEGLYAATLADIRVLVGPATYRHAAATFRGADGETAAQSYLASHTGGFRASRRIADPDTNVQSAIVRRAAPGRVAVSPVWQGVELIRDPYSAAGEGETILTVLLLMGGVAILRPAAFVADSFRLAA